MNANQSFTNIAANSTTPLFHLPRGLYQMTVNAVDPNDPGTVTLTDYSNSYVVLTVTQSLDQLQQGGVATFQSDHTRAWQISVTSPVKNVNISQIGDV